MRLKIEQGKPDNLMIFYENDQEINLKISDIKKEFSVNWKYNDLPAVSVSAMVDPSGYVRDDIITGKFFISTSNDDGKLRKRVIIDKDGRVVVFGQLWSTTYLPTGSPLLIQSNYDEDSDGCRATFRRSRNTFMEPTTVKNGDSIFRITFAAHDGFQYKDVAYISAAVTGETSKGVIPSQLTFKTTNDSGEIKESLILNKNQTVEIKGLLKVSSHLEVENIIPEKGMIIFNESLNKFQGFDGNKWVNLN